MFGLKKIREAWPICGPKDLTSSAASASRMWYQAGHVFILDQTNQRLVCNDILPVDKVWLNARRQTLDVQLGGGDAKDARILTVLQVSMTAFMLVLVSGEVQMWVYDHDQYNWTQNGSCNLIGREGGHVTSVVYDGKTCTMFWCQGPDEDAKRKMNYSVCSLTLPKDISHMREETLVTRSELLTNSQACELHLVGESLLIWFREPCPPGLFMMWRPHRLTLEVHVHPRGCVSSHRKYSQTLNVQNIMEECTAFWAAAKPISSMLRVMDSANQRLICIDTKGNTSLLYDKSSLQHALSLDEVDAIGPDTLSAIMDDYLVILQANLKIYRLSTGSLIQQLEAPGHDLEVILDLCVTSGPLPQCAVLTNRDVYLLQMIRDKASSFSSQSVLRSLVPDTPIQMALEEAYNHLQKGSATVDAVRWEEMLNGVCFQSPALLIALLSEYREKDSAGSAELQKIVHRLLSNNNVEFDHTTLHRKLSPYVEQFWKLEQKKQRLFTIKREQNKQDVAVDGAVASSIVGSHGDGCYMEVCSLLDPLSSLGLESRCASLGILAGKYPVRVLNSILKYLDEKPPAEGIRWDAHARWNTLLGAGERHHSSDDRMPLFDLLCRLMFCHLPKQLAHLVQAAQIVYNKQRDGSAFMSQGKNLSEHVLNILPDARKSHDLTAAAMATVDLTIASGVANAELKSLHILLKHHLWPAAILLVEQQDPEVRSLLFNALISAATKEGVLSQYSREILALTPENVSFDEILEKLQESCAQSTPGGENVKPEVEIFSSGPDAMKIGSVRQCLVEKLTSEPSNYKYNYSYT